MGAGGIRRPTHSAFPEPAALAITTPRGLLGLQVSGPKAGYIITISRLALDGALDLENLRQLEPALAHEKLLGLKAWALDSSVRGTARPGAFGLPARRGRGFAESHPPFLWIAQAAHPRTRSKNGSGMARLAKLRHLLPVAHVLGKCRMEE